MSAFQKNLEKKKTTKGWGVFSKVLIPANIVIFEFAGNVLSADKVPNPLTSDKDYFLQIGTDKFLGPSGGLDDYINHSCTPNCGVVIVGSRALLKSIVQIASGAEITFDYSTTSTDTKENWMLQCACGNYTCRKDISGFQYLPDETKKYYKSLGVVPNYLMDK